MAALGRAMGSGARGVGVAAAIVIIMLGAMIAGVFALAVAAYGCLRPSSPGRPGHGRTPGIRSVEPVRLSDVHIPQQALPQPRT